MSVPPNLNPDNISLREMSTAGRFMIMFGLPIPRCEWNTAKGFGIRGYTGCEKNFVLDDGMIFCPNCGSRVKFITK